MGWENIPLNTCPLDAPVLPAVELVDQDGRVLNVIVASICDAEWLAVVYAELGMYEGATLITCRLPAETPPEGRQEPFPEIGDAPPAPPLKPEETPPEDLPVPAESAA